jgi:1-acyl-sn-glycerol-3-phosphate acyltransferase
VKPSFKKPFLYSVAWHSFRVLFPLYFRWRVLGSDQVPDEGPVILASSHASFLDPPLVGTAVRRMCNYLARATLFRHPLFGRVLRAVGAMPVDRDGGNAAGLKRILGRLKEGSAVILFPGGPPPPGGRLQKARSGIGLMVLKSGAPVVPVRILGSYESWGRHRRLPRPRQITVKFGRVLRFDRQCAETQTCPKERLRVLYQEVSDEIMAAIAALGPS